MYQPSLRFLVVGATIAISPLVVYSCWGFITKRVVHPNFRNNRNSFRASRFGNTTRGTTPEHLENGTLRNSFIDYAYSFCESISCRPYFINPRDRCLRDGVAYSRVPKNFEDRFDFHRSGYAVNDCYILVDVDYYLDWSEFSSLASEFKPMLLFTFSPDSVCGFDVECRFYANSDDTFSVSYNAGGSYRHHVWNFDGEFVSFYGSIFIYVYKIERKRLSSTREIIFLIPADRYCLLAFRPWRSLTLGRAKLFVGDLQCRRISTESGCYLHLAPPGSFQPFKVDVNLVETCRVRLSLANTPTPHIVETHIRAHVADAAQHACLLYRYLMGPSVKDESVVLGYSVTENTTFEQTSSYRQAHPPFDANGSVPHRTRLNDEWTVDARIESVRSSATFDPLDQSVLDIFLSNFRPLVPVDISVVEARQSRPMQRNLREAVGPVLSDSEFRVKTFQKMESYPAIKPPRNISTVDAGFKTEYSKYTYAIFDFCTQMFPWFSPGKTPVEISNFVLELSQLGLLSEADYSKFDGSKSLAAVHIEENILKTCFPDDDYVLQLFRRQLGASATTSYGVRYNVGTSRLSGSPDTTILNTLINAFIAFYALRSYSYQVSGDDIIYTGECDLAAAASKFGYTLEVVQHPRFPTYLGRVYHDLPTTPKSFYDLKRFIPKMHIVVASRNVPLHIAVARRADGYSVTDPYTPVISDWCQAMYRHYGHSTTTKYDHLIDLPFTIADNNYPVEESEPLLDVVCEYLGKTPEYLDSLISSLRLMPIHRYETLDELIIPPGVTVDGVSGPENFSLRDNLRSRRRRNGRHRSNPSSQASSWRSQAAAV